MPDNKLTAYQKYCKVTNVVFQIMNGICVLSLLVELFAVTVMVVGRYVFNSVPVWTEQMSTTALAWMSVVAIALGLYDESHMRVEVLDNTFPAKFVVFLKYASNVMIIIFSVLMIKHGYILVDLTKKVKLSGFRISTGILYLPLIICGVGSIYMSIFCMVRRHVESKEDK